MYFTGSPGMSRKRKKLVTRTASSETAAPPNLPATYRRYAVVVRARGPRTDGPAWAGPSVASTSEGVASAVMNYSFARTFMGSPWVSGDGVRGRGGLLAVLGRGAASHREERPDAHENDD